jgi:sulfatase maturation enzyme AslB (radical SAM superfamily)
MNVCIDAFKNLNVVSSVGLELGPCCLSAPMTAEKIDFYNNEYLQTVRNSWSQGVWPQACNNCKQNENQGLISRRQGSNSWYRDNDMYNTDVELVRLDYWTGNLCNLACVICGPEFSSVWKQELNYPTSSKKTIVNNFWTSVDTSNLRYVHFNGGEPLLSKEHVKFLHALPNKNLIHINYNTNGTVLPNQELIDLWSQYKLVQIDFSIDDIGQRFEYQRYPAKWADIVENLQWFIDHAPHNCMFAVNTTVSILNQHNLNNLNQWLQENFYESRFTDIIEHRQQLAYGIFALSRASREPASKFLDECDARRGTNWRTTFPELAVE